MRHELALASASDRVLRPAGRRSVRPRAFGRLVLHLTARQLKSSHHLTLLGWTWPVVRQLAQLAVLLFVFDTVLDLDVDNYPAFLFIGLMAWTWFSAAVSGAATSVLNQRHLVMQPRLPPSVLPVVAVVVPLVDLLIAFPVLVVQLLLLAGVGSLVAGLSVFFRDLPNLIGVGLMVLFYLTPVFYEHSQVPESVRWVLDLNPLTTIIEVYRSVLLGTPWPDTVPLAAVVVASVALALVGHRVFIRLAPRFSDHL
jgi:lipopolysaccharide transport system permease protein